MELEKIYDHSLIESDIAKKWKEKKIFSKHDLSKKPFTILLPPPNVTGKLHIGHALDTYIQDTIIRYKKLSGFDTFYIAGMDHAGIATQSKVENMLYQNEGINRHDLGREKFLKKVWEWKEEYAQLFRKQWQSLGLALDYEKERFTLDEQSNQAVLKTFITLYKKGLIYKGTKAINWDPVLKTALSNIEVINKLTEQVMYYIKYPILNSDEHFVVATVRTETMLSDVAVIYNPKDKRYKNYKDIKIVHPLTKQIIPFIADEYADMKFGSGLMKLSAHAEVDIDIIKKHNLEIIETIDKDGLINCPKSQFHRLNRQEAREKIAQYLQENNLLVKSEKVTSNVGYSERSGAPVEILVMPQWFVKMNKLAHDILNHLKSKDAVNFYPKRFINVIKKWMENIHDWTISRQLWWGHRIPAWYKDDKIKVQIESPGESWVQDEDVLDTWFSSGIAPFSFLGWPKQSALLKRYYPTSLLVTGYDIIFFWVARMYFFGLELMDIKPFERVLIHGLVRDEFGKKMSKSSNNGVDPIQVISENGSDALRWFMITNTSPGLDIRYSSEKINSAWALCNKLWNIARYIQLLPNDKENKRTSADIWIHNKLVALKKKVDKAMQNYEFTIIGSELSKFIYNDFSSWYVELLKIMPSKNAALENLKNLLLIAHPFLPFITDHLYKVLFNKELLEQEYNNLKIQKAKNLEQIDQIISVVNILRKYREENNISKKEILYYDCNIEKNEFIINSLKALSNSEISQNKDTLFVDGNINVYIKESAEQKKLYIAKLNEKIAHLENEIKRSNAILNNQNFIAKAPANKVEEEKQKLAKYQEEYNKYKEELEWKS
ncbi:valine--tRNA ligase [Mycoplasmopsis caviae]|uniref:Valine--tRNA ligase n=1 Tax=Mycoplasmopsis caviae TaxID=55603 RepID=A0A3P8MEQ3_9BACT|nr:valine--tRNA ligase [Mycoplasmopsis caviae]UUD35048.1 valine--tRNA ligase [Mycoplasmopsis caviae]VDR42126.1 Valine--tRNA ligase [Mycoplasmopsis caviae]